MNRFSILIALVAFVGLAGATFHHKGGLKHHGLRHHLHPQHFHDGEDFGDVESHHGGHFQDEEEFGLGHGIRHHGGHGDFDGGFNRHGSGSGLGLGHRHGSERFGGSHFGGGHKHAGKHLQGGKLRRGGLHSGGGLNRHSGIGSGFDQGSIGGGSNRLGHRHRHGGVGGVGGAGGVGAGVIGAHRGQKEFEAGLGGSNHGESNFGVEGHQGAQLSGEGHLNKGHSRGENDNLEGLHQHQVINKDKTIVKEKTNGVNDVDGFRHSTGSHDDRHSELGASGSASENSGASLNRQNEFDNEFGAGVGGESSSETVGAAGIGAAGAAGAN